MRAGEHQDYRYDVANRTLGPTAADEVVEICRDLIRLDTTNTGDTETSAGEQVAAEYVAAKLAEVGLEPVLHSSAQRAHQCGGPVPRGAARSRDGRSGARCWCTAISTSCRPTPDEWSVHPFSGEIRDGYLWGRGARST